jgi:hypothetical protein
MILDTIHAFGHKNILCTHNTTIEITKDNLLTKKGNCILGIRSSKACVDLNSKLKALLKLGNRFKINVIVGEYKDYFYGYGHPDLTLLDKKDMVFRKSQFICDRTVLIKCTKSSNELNKLLIEQLKTNDEKLKIEFEKVANHEK